MVPKLFSSPVGKKIGMALTGVILYGFLIAHLSGNLLLLKGDSGKAFNAYSDFLIGHPLLLPMEIFLFATFVLHIYLAIGVSLDNRRARPVGYKVSRSVGERSWASSSMIYSGTLILVFLFIHIKGFKYGNLGGGTLSNLVISTFQQIPYMLWYVFSMIVLGFHMWHAFQSAFQTLGIGAGKKIKALGLILCLILTLGFGILPVYLGVLSK